MGLRKNGWNGLLIPWEQAKMCISKRPIRVWATASTTGYCPSSYPSRPGNDNPTTFDLLTFIPHHLALHFLFAYSTSVLSTALSIDSSSAGNGDGEISNWEFFLAIDPNNVHGSDMVYDHFGTSLIFDTDRFLGLNSDSFQ